MKKLGDGSYMVIKNGAVLTFSHWDEIPDQFDELIKFSPSIPPPPRPRSIQAAIDALPATMTTFMKRATGHAGGH